MTQENHFNLVDEPWLPVADVGLVSLRQIFTHPEYRTLGGNPVQKIALTKLLLAIAQAAATPTDDTEWTQMGAAGMVQRCLVYLDKWHDRFWLYGEKPFLQMPAITQAIVQSYGAVSPEVATGNTTVLTQIHIDKPLTEAEQAQLLVCLMGFALGGKKLGKNNVTGKSDNARPGVSLGSRGLLHSFLLGSSLQETLWLNLLTSQEIAGVRVWTVGQGQPPWEQMPSGKECPVVQQLRNSLMGRLVPLSRFCLLTENGLHYSEGIAHPSFKEGMIDPSVAINYSGKEPKALWVDPQKRPWRFLTAMLSFISQSSAGGFDCLHLYGGLARARVHVGVLGVWSGGLRVSNQSGEQYVTGDDDFVESVVMLPQEILGTTWFMALQREIDELEGASNTLKQHIIRYGNALGSKYKGQADQAVHLFWQLCESRFQQLVDGCDDAEQVGKLRHIFARFVWQGYNRFCPHDTARQLDAWAENQPNLSRYLAAYKQPQEGNA